ncbi:hypothetical protein [Salinarchaeum laminariae]|uniref:hypothetical protein n=1 Tax=Salinarchaeum laminariae TaxID=869888 RepID=UPI0020BF5DA1|nr:hypothetical protein [Salinarchaeum laminariae]
MTSDDSMRSRVPGSRFRLWLLLGANRWAVAGMVLAVIFVALAVFVAIDPVPLSDAIAASDPTETLFQAMITSIITGVTLVVTINQVVLSQELGAVGDQRDRMQAALAFRDDVADDLDEPVSPPEPSAFLHALLGATADRARALREDVADVDDQEARDAVESFADELIENAETVREGLDSAQFGTFDVVQAALGFNYSLKIYEGKRIQGLYGGGTDAGSDEDGDDATPPLDEDATAALDDVVTHLERFGPAREHVKTLYFQWSLTDLSQAMLYSAIPALVVTIAGLLVLGNAGTIGGTTLGVANQSWLVITATTVALAPFAILLSFVLRIATVAKRTLAMGPFVLRTTDRPDDD